MHHLQHIRDADRACIARLLAQSKNHLRVEEPHNIWAVEKTRNYSGCITCWAGRCPLRASARTVEAEGLIRD